MKMLLFRILNIITGLTQNRMLTSKQTDDGCTSIFEARQCQDKCNHCMPQVNDMLTCIVHKHICYCVINLSPMNLWSAKYPASVTGLFDKLDCQTGHYSILEIL